MKNRIHSSETLPDIITITEAKPKSLRYCITPSELNLDGFNVFSTNLDSDTGRGMVTYISKSLNTTEVDLNKEFIEFQCHDIQLHKDDKVRLLTIYRSPNSLSGNNDNLVSLLDSLSTNELDNLIILGDFNFPTIDWSTTSCNGPATSPPQKFLDCLQEHFWHQHIDKPTRVRGLDNPSTLDLLITNEPYLIDNVTYDPPLGNSDHVMLCVQTTCKTTKVAPTREVLDFSKANFNLLRETLDVDWNQLLNQHPDNLEQQWGLFLNTYNHAIEECIPRKKIKNRNTSKPQIPLSNETVRLIKKKHRLWTRYYETKQEHKLQEYKKIRNKVKNCVKRDKRNYEKHLANHVKGNPKIFWKYVNNKLRSKAGIPDLKTTTENGTTVASEDEEKAEALNKFFASVMVTEPEGPIPELLANHALPDCPSLSDVTITPDKITKKINKLPSNKSPGPDHITARILKEVAIQVAIPLAKIFNLSLQTGSLPDIWRLSHISAIHKKGSKSVCDNYRPISLTSIICKIMESIIRDEIMDHFITNNLINPKQYGFVPKRTTMLQLLNVLDEWTEAINNNQSIEVIYMDFRKAFDSVPHKRLLYKLNHYKISGQLYDWIKCFLTERHQQVIVNGKSSTASKTVSGIPQGSVLGPLLFVIFINDLPDILLSRAYLFADDTKIFSTSQHDVSETAQDDIDKDLASLDKWSEDWLLKFNAKKCHQLFIHKPRQTVTTTTRYLKDEHNEPTPLECVTCEKDLGITIDNHLNFQRQINTMVSKASRNMGIIRRTISHLEKDIFVPLYTTLVRSHLEYGHSVWSPHLIGDIKKLEAVQRAATKKVNGLREMDYSDRLKHLGLTTLSFRRLRGDMINVYKILKGVYDHEATLSLTRDMAGRRGNSLKLLVEGGVNNDIRKYSFRVRIVKHWNNLPDAVVTAPSVNSFKNRLDNYWKDHPLKYDPDMHPYNLSNNQNN